MIGLKMVFKMLDISLKAVHPYLNNKQALNKNKYYVDLSKKMAFALRHKPEQCGLTLDKEGFVRVDALLAYLKSFNKYCNITLKDIKETLKNIEKKRFELKDENIRAYYGHTCEQKIEKTASIPPNVLYHGTSHEAAEKILKEGIKSQKRQYIHMSADTATANNVGMRKDNNPIILEVDALRANQNGVKFYLGNETTWLADYIPPEYINFKK